MNSKIKDLIEDCGTVIEPLNMEVTWKEIEFLCEKIIKECANICDDHPGFSGRILSELILNRFGIKQ